MPNVLELLQLPPIDYREMLWLMEDARVVLTDSGGTQEETTALGVLPCIITLRDNAESPITADEGTSTIAGRDPVKILAVFDEIMRSGGNSGRIPDFCDRQASTRTATAIHERLKNGLRS